MKNIIKNAIKKLALLLCLTSFIPFSLGAAMPDQKVKQKKKKRLSQRASDFVFGKKEDAVQKTKESEKTDLAQVNDDLKTDDATLLGTKNEEVKLLNERIEALENQLAQDLQSGSNDELRSLYFQLIMTLRSLPKTAEREEQIEKLRGRLEELEQGQRQ